MLLATGHYRNGVLLAPATGEAIAAMLAGDPAPEGFERFSPGRFSNDPHGPGEETAPLESGARR